MLIYGALFIPFITAILLYKFFKRKVVWWELCVPILASLVFIVIMKLCIEKVQVTSKEYWGSLVARVEYYEPWDEWVTETCFRSCCCDSKGENCSTESYDCSHSVYHSAIYQIVTTTGETIEIDSQEYLRLKNKFLNESFIELNRDYYTQDGNEYVCRWEGQQNNAVSVTSLHHYENRVKVADQSVFNFEKVSDQDIKKYDLFEYPEIFNYYDMNVVLGDKSKDAKIANEKFKYINGLLGSKKQMKVFVLVFKNQPLQAGFYQQAYWSGGNKNEFIIAVGINNNGNILWCKPMSWTTNQIAITRVKDFVQQQNKLNLSKLADYCQVELDKDFVRREFKEFDYLTVEPPMWAVLLTYFLTLLINVGLSYWIVRNEFYEFML